jgi:hypothetical protein
MATGFNVNSNISSMKTYRAFAQSQTKLEASIERLSTGLRINKASDDTEGAAIATRLDNRVRALQKAQKKLQTDDRHVTNRRGIFKRYSQYPSSHERISGARCF